MDSEDLKKLAGYKRFKELMNELLQAELADLDFGIYRVLNQRRKAIERYFGDELPSRLAVYLEGVETASREELERRLEQARAELKRKAPKLLDAKGHLTEEAQAALETLGGGEVGDLIQTIRSLEKDLYKHELTEAQVNDVLLLLHDFFSRYYDEGDFIPQSRFVRDEYALGSYETGIAPSKEDFPGIPYGGQEVYFHWATRGMHYIKSDTVLKNYSFHVDSLGLLSKAFQVRFVLDEVDEVSGNNKVTRFFYPKPEKVEVEGRTLIIPFDYKIKDKEGPNKQGDVFAERLEAILEAIPDPEIKQALDKNLLLKHMKRFAAMGKKDFFIHPYLKNFLERELDYFIKSKALHWADVQSETALKRRVAVLKAFRSMALDLADFLHQLEMLQAQLFEKKRLVYQTDYLVPMRFVPEDLWDEILANGEQVKEWRDWMGLEVSDKKTLATHPSLPLHTSHFPREFVRRLIQALPAQFQGEEEEATLDGITDGLLIHSENYGALRTLEPRYREKVKTIYIDPPYNTGSDEFIYKDAFRHSSWLSMMEERLRLAKEWMREDGVIFVSIDDVEQSRLKLLLDSVFSQNNFVASIAWWKRHGRNNNAKICSDVKDFLLWYRKTDRLSHAHEPRTELSNASYSNPDNDPRGPWTSISYVNPASKEERPNLVYGIKNPFTGEEVWHPTNAWKYSKEEHERHVKEHRLYWGLRGENKYPRLKVFLSEVGGLVPKDVWTQSEAGTTDLGSKQIANLFGKKLFNNPKPSKLIEKIGRLMLNGGVAQDAAFLDYFAGSGTTGHAVINLNREDGGRRKFILVEMGDYFDTVLVPRIAKVMYAPEWKDGKPKEEPNVDGDELPEWMERSPRLVKILRLESYEDALYNLVAEPSDREEAIMAMSQKEEWRKRPDEAFPERDPYFLEYFADAMTDGNPTMLRPFIQGELVDTWKDPDAIRIRRVKAGTRDGFEEQSIDWLETASLWLGLQPIRYEEIKANGRIYRILRTRKNGEDVAVVVRNAHGLNPHEDRSFLEGLGGRVIVNDPPVPAFEALEDALREAMMEGPR